MCPFWRTERRRAAILRSRVLWFLFRAARDLRVRTPPVIPFLPPTSLFRGRPMRDNDFPRPTTRGSTAVPSPGPTAFFRGLVSRTQLTKSGDPSSTPSGPGGLVLDLIHANPGLRSSVDGQTLALRTDPEDARYRGSMAAWWRRPGTIVPPSPTPSMAGPDRGPGILGGPPVQRTRGRIRTGARRESSWAAAHRSDQGPLLLTSICCRGRSAVAGIDAYRPEPGASKLP